MTTTGVFKDAVSAAVRAYFDKTKEDILDKVYGSELFSEYEADVPAEQLSGVAGPGLGTLTLEGQQYGSNELWEEYKKTVSLRKYTSELSWTKEDAHFVFGKASEAKRQMKLGSIASNAIRPLIGNINVDVAKMFYLANGTTFFTGGDAVALVASNHPIRKTGSTQTNIVTSNAVLSADGVQTAVNQMNRFQSMNGRDLLPVRRLRLVVPKELTATACQIRDSLYGPSNANLGLQKSSASQMMKAQGIDFDVLTLPDISSSYAAYWWLVDLDRAKERFFLVWGWKPEMASDTVGDHGTYKVDADVMFGPSALGWQWIIQSTGAGV
jgi:hypothetical protein